MMFNFIQWLINVSFIKPGWLKKHEFNESDLKAAIELLDQITQEVERSGKKFKIFTISVC